MRDAVHQAAAAYQAAAEVFARGAEAYERGRPGSALRSISGFAVGFTRTAAWRWRALYKSDCPTRSANVKMPS
jgi:hypothetical protein